MKAGEIREKDNGELMELLEKLRKRAFQLRTEFHTDEEPDTSEKKKLRKDIARLLTIMQERKVDSEMESHKEPLLTESETGK